jgi:hypothetical protein
MKLPRRRFLGRTGKIAVDVTAPKGTRVGAEGGGLFKNVEMNRQTSMETAQASTGGGKLARLLK